MQTHTSGWEPVGLSVESCDMSREERRESRNTKVMPSPIFYRRQRPEWARAQYKLIRGLHSAPSGEAL